MKNNRGMMSVIGALAAVVFVSGCATSGYQKAGKSAASMTDTKAEMQGAFTQVTLAINSLDKIMKAQVGDLRPLYKDFAAQVKDLEDAAQAARSRALSMQAKNQEYFATWAQEIEAISDPSIKKQSLTRYNATKTSYQEVEKSLFKIRDAYVPLISSLTDIGTVLNQDLTPAGIAPLRPVYSKARKQAIDLQSDMKNSMKAMDAAAQKLAPQASPSSM
jgi:hypothetical protein